MKNPYNSTVKKTNNPIKNEQSLQIDTSSKKVYKLPTRISKDAEHH